MAIIPGHYDVQTELLGNHDDFSPAGNWGYYIVTDDFGYDQGFNDGVDSVVPIDPDLEYASPKPVSRWVPYVFKVAEVDQMFIIFDTGQLRFCVYDSTRIEALRWSAFFGQRSSVVEEEDGTWTITILPNGGWTNATFALRVISGTMFVNEGFTLR